MEPEIAIKYSYIKNRERPSEVFEAIGLYIETYEHLTQLIGNAVGIEQAIPLKLNSVITSSILSKLSAIPESINSKLEALIYESSEKLVDELIATEETNTEEQVNFLAETLEAELEQKFPNTFLPPHLDRPKLALVLDSLSKANQKVAQGETVSISTNNNKLNEKNLNTRWRFTGNAKEMFKGKTEHFEHEDALTTSVAVFEGKSVWSFRSIKTGTKFNAKITDEFWLKRYQAGLEQRIGPKDVVIVEIEYDKYTPPGADGEFEIKKAQVKKIKNIIRDRRYQHD